EAEGADSGTHEVLRRNRVGLAASPVPLPATAPRGACCARGSPRSLKAILVRPRRARIFRGDLESRSGDVATTYGGDALGPHSCGSGDVMAYARRFRDNGSSVPECRLSVPEGQPESSVAAYHDRLWNGRTESASPRSARAPRHVDAQWCAAPGIDAVE